MTPIVIGTADGIHTYAPADGTARVADCGQVNRLLAAADGDRIYATTGDGLLRSAGDPTDWERLDVPNPDLFGVEVAPTDELLVGTHDPADVYVSEDGGESWTKNRSFAALPGHDDWDNLAPTSTGRVRDVVTVRAAPHRRVVGVEAAGVFVSDDGGDAWERRVDGLNHDVHHLVARGPDEYVAATGRGVYRTTDAGRTWRALDTHRDLFWYTYYRAVLAHRGRLFTSGQDRAAARFTDEGEGIILVSEDGGRTFSLEPFPGDERDYVNAWTVRDGTPVGGTIRGTLLERTDGEWEAVAEVPTTVRALAAV